MINLGMGLCQDKIYLIQRYLIGGTVTATYYILETDSLEDGNF